MQKITATFLASLLLVPAGSFAQDSRVNDGPTIGQGHAATASAGTLRASAIRQARLVVATNDTVVRPGPSWISRHPVGFGALLGTGVGTVAASFASVDYCAGSAPTCNLAMVPRGALLGAAIGVLTGQVIKVLRP